MAATTVDENNVAEAMGGEKTNVVEVVVDEKSKTITLVSTDGECFEITHEAAAMSQTIDHMIEDDCVHDKGVRLPNVCSRVLAKVIEYCNKHASASSDAKKEDLKIFDAAFVKVEHATLFDIVHTANYLDIKGLLDLSCQTVADMIKVRTDEESRTLFNVKNDFMPEEEDRSEERTSARSSRIANLLSMDA